MSFIYLGKMSHKQLTTMKRQLQSLEREIKRERDSLKSCEEDLKAATVTKDDSVRLQIQTQIATHKASIEVMEEDMIGVMDIIKNLQDKEADLREFREVMEEDIQRKLDNLTLGGASEEREKDIDTMMRGLMKFASSLEGAAHRMGREETRPHPRGEVGPPGPRKMLGTLPSFISGSSDFILHLKSFKDFIEINEITDVGKTKRLFLNTFDQVSRMRCSSIDPGLPPHNLSTLADFYDAVRDLFIPKSEMQILRQAFYDHRQGAKVIAMDYMMEKWSKYKRAWNNAPFSFFFENCTSGLYNEELRHEVYRKIIDCDNPANEVAMAQAFAEYVEHVQECTAYVRRTVKHGNPDIQGLSVSAQKAEGASGQTERLGVREVIEKGSEDYLEQVFEEDEDGDPAEYELDEEQIALVESLEDPFFTEMINKDPASFEEMGDSRRCFICNSENHIARFCGQRLEMRKPFLRRAMRGGSSWRGGRGDRRGRASWRARNQQGINRQPPLSPRNALPVNNLSSKARPVVENPKKFF